MAALRIPRKVRRVLERRRIVAHSDAHVSYSQCGEDLITEFVLMGLRIDCPVYFDIGANDPVRFSNTYHFYCRGCRGVCVEPDPSLASKFRRWRPKDRCIEVGVGIGSEVEADFFVMHPHTLNTFVEEDARRLDQLGDHRLVDVVKVPLRPVNQILQEEFSKAPDFVSLDIEGLDLEVLRTWDFSRVRPAVFCVETIDYSPGQEATKNTAIEALMKEVGYQQYADTNINSIFVDDERWRKRHASAVAVGEERAA